VRGRAADRDLARLRGAHRARASPTPATLRSVSIGGFFRALVTTLVWGVVAALIAIGSAGILATMNHTPGTPARAELTAAGDAAIGPALDAATGTLQALSDEVDSLAGTARDALTQVVAGDESALQDSIGKGSEKVLTIGGLRTDLEAALAAVPYTGDDWALHVAADEHRRYDALAGTVEVTAGFADDWAAFADRSLSAAKITRLLERHDQETADAAKLGSAGKYKEALKQLDKSDATIADARKLRDALAGSTDVSTLTAWLDRNADYDAALRNLYVELIGSKARVTDPVKRAFAREQQARAALPGDTQGMVVIMSDIAQGGLNETVISLETARGTLADALDLVQLIKDGTQLQLPE
jgi:hypothetical protein